MKAIIVVRMEVPLDTTVDELPAPELTPERRLVDTAAYEEQQANIEDQRTQAAKDAEKKAQEITKSMPNVLDAYVEGVID